MSKPGTLTLPAKKLFEIVNALPETEIRIAEDKGGKSVTIAADRFESRMQTLPASEFPTPPEDGGQRRKRCCPVAALKRMISHTRFAITSEDTRYFLNGAQLVLRPDSMSMVATDGHRLAFISVQESPGKSAKTEVLLPRKTLNEVARLIDGGVVDRVLAGREPPVFQGGRPAADLAEDRRELPGLRARDSEDERQDGSNSTAIGWRPRCGACGCSRTSARKP